MVVVRDATMEDARRILEIYDYYVKNTAITFEYVTPSLDEFMERMKKIMQRYPYLVILKDGHIEGFAYAGAFVGRAAYDWSCEMTVYIDHNAQKCGYKFGRWYNMIWMEKNIGKHEAEEKPITCYTKLKKI